MSAGQIGAGDRGQRITCRTIGELHPDRQRARQRVGRGLRDQFLLRGEVSVEPTMREPASFIRSATPIPSKPRSRNSWAAASTIRSRFWTACSLLTLSSRSPDVFPLDSIMMVVI